MPFVMGYLRRVRRPGRPGRPDIGLPEPEEPVDPDYGIPEGELPVEPPEPDPPPGLWPPLTPEHPWRPIPSWPERPSTGPVPTPPPPGVGGGPARPERPVDPGWGVEGPPPGAIWPPLPPAVSGKYWALVLIGGMPGGPKYRYVVVDAGLRPEHPIVRPPARPDQGLPPTAQPR